MQPLDKDLRTKLERTVKEARDVAEGAARAALDNLGVGEANPYDHLNEEARDLRRRLRIHGRQLGDSRDNKTEKQEIDRLVEEVAYEHWHRMLFARFLAENNLLMFPDPDNPVPVTLQECEDLAADEGAKNGWELASSFAARMLPQIFRPDSPVFELHLPPESQQALERLLDDLPPGVFTASDSLGWVYQFWQAKRKDEVNASEVKIGARELPAVTQLFTEPYMVSFLLDNSLGAWWAARRLAEDDLIRAESEDVLRDKASLPGVPLEYLRFVREGDGKWTPAAGTFDGWPEHLSELKTMDPCCGSGHFLVSALLMLVPMRIELEGLSAQDAVDAVLRENIHGLEIDQRCVEIAAFNLALAAWRFPGTGGYRPLPKLNLACSGLSVSVAKEEWKSLALDKHNLRIALDWLHEEFKDAPVLGSLINPARSDAAKLVPWEELEPMLEEALSREQTDEQHEMSVVAHGLVEAARLLGGKYHWVISNVPYLTRGKQSVPLKEFFEKKHQEAKHDLATVFLDRCIQLCKPNVGNTSLVLPQNWMFLVRYKQLRANILRETTWSIVGLLGSGAFETVSGEVVKSILLSINSRTLEKASDVFKKQENPHLFFGLDASELNTIQEKECILRRGIMIGIEQERQLENPDARVVLGTYDEGVGLSEFAISMRGIVSGDSDRWIRNLWEIERTLDRWRCLQSTPTEAQFFSGREHIIDWVTNGKGMLRPGTTNEAYGKIGIAVGLMSDLQAVLYLGDLYDNNTGTIVPTELSQLAALWCYCSSSSYLSAIRRIDKKMNVTNATLLKVPFDLEHWQKVAAEKYPNGLPKPYSNDPTQWIFHGHPCCSVIWEEEKKWTASGPLRTDDTVLQVATARLLGYRWPAELVAHMELADEQREWVKRCETLLPYADDDGIVCIPAVRGEASGADRLLDLLAATYGDDWAAGKLGELLSQVDHAGKSLETWLRDKFFAQHCKLFHNRPFIWHIWDGLRDGFSVLINYHKLDNKKLETLIYTYLGDWIARQKDDLASGVDGAQERLAAAENLKKRLELIIQGEAPCDIFVRWKPIEEQPVGWNPDLDDGVRMNIRPFLAIADVGKKDAGVLRDKPNIKWNKDRGKDVQSAPWYHKFKGERINDHHLTLEEKNAAREKKKAKL
jgi:hypothetical protein